MNYQTPKKPHTIVKILLILNLSLLLINCTTPNSSNKPQKTSNSYSQSNHFLENKDLDGDQIADQILFTYSGGGHCCYQWSIILSSNKERYDFPFDMDGGYENGIPDDSQPQHFNIKDYDQDGRDEIYMEIATYNGRLQAIPPDWTKKYGVNSNYIVIDYEQSLRIINIDKHIAIEQYFLQKNQAKNTSNSSIYAVGNKANGYKYGLKNEQGDLLILPLLDTLTTFVNNAALAVLHDDPILINQQGKIIRNFEGYSILDQQLSKEGLLLIANENIDAFYFVNYKGAIINQTAYQDAKSFSEGLAAVQIETGKWGYIDATNLWVISPKYDMAHPFNEGKAFIEWKGKFHWIDRGGEFVGE